MDSFDAFLTIELGGFNSIIESSPTVLFSHAAFFPRRRRLLLPSHSIHFKEITIIL